MARRGSTRKGVGRVEGEVEEVMTTARRGGRRVLGLCGVRLNERFYP